MFLCASHFFPRLVVLRVVPDLNEQVSQVDPTSSSGLKNHWPRIDSLLHPLPPSPAVPPSLPPYPLSLFLCPPPHFPAGEQLHFSLEQLVLRITTGCQSSPKNVSAVKPLPGLPVSWGSHFEPRGDDVLGSGCVSDCRVTKPLPPGSCSLVTDLG